MNILFPIGSFYPSQQGGPCNSVYALAKGLVKAGHEVRVVTTYFYISPSAGISPNQWTEIDGIKVYYMLRPSPERSIMHDLLLLTKPSLLANIIKENPIDIMHATMVFAVLPHLAADYAKKHKIPLIWSPRGSMLPYAFSRRTLKKKLFLSLPFVKHGLQQAHFHATSPEEAVDIANWMRWYTGEDVTGRTTIIPNIMSDEGFTAGSDTSTYPYKYVLYLGRIHPIKKLENLIEGFGGARMPQETRLVIAGWTGEDPEYTKMLKGLVEKLNLGDRVVFTEKRVEGRDKATLYRHAEVFVLPSESENFGMVVIESLAQGVPVIASNKTPWQVLEQKGAGFWPANDPASLAESLTRFFSLSGDERKKLSANSTMLAQEYNNDALIGKYLQMYEEVLKHEWH